MISTATFSRISFNGDHSLVEAWIVNRTSNDKSANHETNG